MTAQTGHDVRYGTDKEGHRYLVCWTCKKSGVKVAEEGTDKRSRRRFQSEASAFLEAHPPWDGWAASDVKSNLPTKSVRQLRSWIS